jgi:hypothetical protein
MMPGFSVKLKVKDARLLYRTAAATLAIKELSCLHLKMKMMTTVNRKLMLEWFKRSGDYST